MQDFPYGGKCPYDNTEVDCTEGGWVSQVWFCQQGHEWKNICDIVAPNRCEGTFKYGINKDLKHSICQWCGQIVEHIPFFHFDYAGLMKYHEMRQPSTHALEMGEWVHVSEHRELVGKECNGCQGPFDQGQIAEVVVDRLSHLGYVIHRGCWDRLVESIEKGRE